MDEGYCVGQEAEYDSALAYAHQVCRRVSTPERKAPIVKQSVSGQQLMMEARFYCGSYGNYHSRY